MIFGNFFNGDKVEKTIIECTLDIVLWNEKKALEFL